MKVGHTIRNIYPLSMNSFIEIPNDKELLRYM